MFLGHFWSFLPDGDFFQKIRLSRTTIYGPLTTYLVSEKTNEPIPRKLTDRRKEGQKDGRTDKPYFIDPIFFGPYSGRGSKKENSTFHNHTKRKLL